MSINQNSSTVVHFIADGEVKEFNFPFRIFAKEDIDVYVNEVLLNQGYEVEIEEKDGGKVIFNQAPAINSKITIIRNLEIKRTSDFQEGGAFRAKVINHELDYQVASLQQLDEKIERAVIYPPYEQERPNLTLPFPSAGKALVWNQEANGLENSTLEINTVSQEIMRYANEAKQSENNAKISEINAIESASNAKQSETNAKLSEEKAKQYADTAAFGNIGDIQYTTRTDVPNGGAWCDGEEYTQAMFPDIYQMLVDGKLNSTDYSTFDSSISTNGACGLFGLDTGTQKFKVPLLKDVYIKAGDTPLAFGAESLPNIKTGEYDLGGISGVSNAINVTEYNKPTKNAGVLRDLGYGQAGVIPTVNPETTVKYLSIDASKAYSAYQDNAKVNPDHVVYKAYVILYASAVEPSVAEASEFINAVTDVRDSLKNKANLDFSNVASSAKQEAISWGIPDYSREQSLSQGLFVPPANGVVEIYGGYKANLGFQMTRDTSGDNSKAILRGAQSGATEVYNGGQAIVEKGRAYYFTGTFEHLERAAFIPFKGEN